MRPGKTGLEINEDIAAEGTLSVRFLPKRGGRSGLPTPQPARRQGPHKERRQLREFQAISCFKGEMESGIWRQRGATKGSESQAGILPVGASPRRFTSSSGPRGSGLRRSNHRPLRSAVFSIRPLWPDPRFLNITHLSPKSFPV